MKTPSFPALAKSWPSLLSTIALACLSLSILASTPLQAQFLVSGFESTEGFVANGQAGGKAGWTNGSVDFVISNQRAYSGSQSLRVKPVSTSSPGSLSSPIIVDQGFSGLSMRLSNPETVPTANEVLFRFRILLGEEIEGVATSQRILQFQFAYQSTPTSANFALGYYGWTDGASTSLTKSVSKSLFNLSNWSEFRFETDASHLTYSVWIGDTEILSAIPIGGTVTANSSVYQVQFWGHNSQRTDAYYDHITGIAPIPEPSSIALLGVVLAGGLIVFGCRKKVAA